MKSLLTVEERLESLERIVARLILERDGSVITLEEQHAGTVERVRKAKERGGLSA